MLRITPEKQLVDMLGILATKPTYQYPQIITGINSISQPFLQLRHSDNRHQGGLIVWGAANAQRAVRLTRAVAH